MIGACKFLIIFCSTRYPIVSAVFLSRFESMMIELCETCILGNVALVFNCFHHVRLRR